MNYEALRKDYAPYRQNKIESGQLYQDFVVDCCWELLKLAVVQYTSRQYQYDVGESKTGVEIKHDENYKNTGNIYIETAEKAEPRSGNYCPSGIFRNDNTWLYVIGDYNTIFVYPKTLLQALSRTSRFPVFENRTKTSQGFLLLGCRGDVEKYAAQILYPNAAKKIGKQIKDLHSLGRELHDVISNTDKSQMMLKFNGSDGGSY